MMEILKKIKKIAAKDDNDTLKAAREQGQGILGYCCAYVPEEILHAAGLIPYRVRVVDSPGTTALADAYYTSLNCSYVRHFFNKCLEKDFDFLSGLVFMNGCDNMRRTFDNWREAGLGGGFIHFLPVPHIEGRNAPEKYLRELKKLAGGLENHFGIEITPEKLKSSISLYNRKRSLLEELHGLRRKAEIPIRGHEVLELMLAVTALPVEVANPLIEELLQALEGRVVNQVDDLRLFVTGSCIEEVDKLAELEEKGAIIVADSFCRGAVYYSHQVDPNGDPLEALAERYLNKLSCPRMLDGLGKRFDSIRKVVKDWQVDAIITQKVQFCDIWGGEIFTYKGEAERLGIPLLSLETEVYGEGSGQVRTRRDAFFERIRNRPRNQSII